MYARPLCSDERDPGVRDSDAIRWASTSLRSESGTQCAWGLAIQALQGCWTVGLRGPQAPGIRGSRALLTNPPPLPRCDRDISHLTAVSKAENQHPSLARDSRASPPSPAVFHSVAYFRWRPFCLDCLVGAGLPAAGCRGLLSNRCCGELTSWKPPMFSSAAPLCIIILFPFPVLFVSR